MFCLNFSRGVTIEAILDVQRGRFNLAKLGYVMFQNADGGKTVESGGFQSIDNAVGAFFGFLSVVSTKSQLDKFAFLSGIHQKR